MGKTPPPGEGRPERLPWSRVGNRRGIEVRDPRPGEPALPLRHEGEVPSARRGMGVEPPRGAPALRTRGSGRAEVEIFPRRAGKVPSRDGDGGERPTPPPSSAAPLGEKPDKKILPPPPGGGGRRQADGGGVPRVPEPGRAEDGNDPNAPSAPAGHLPRRSGGGSTMVVRRKILPPPSGALGRRDGGRRGRSEDPERGKSRGQEGSVFPLRHWRDTGPRGRGEDLLLSAGRSPRVRSLGQTPGP